MAAPTNLIVLAFAFGGSLHVVSPHYEARAAPAYYPASLINYPNCPTELMTLKSSFLNLQAQAGSDRRKYEAEIQRLYGENVGYGRYIQSFIDSVNSLLRTYDTVQLGAREVTFPDLKGVLDLFEQALRQKALFSPSEAYQREREALVRAKLGVRAQLKTCSKELETATEVLGAIKARVEDYPAAIAAARNAPHAAAGAQNDSSLEGLHEEAELLTKELWATRQMLADLHAQILSSSASFGAAAPPASEQPK